VIGFEGIPDVEARLVNFDLEDLDNRLMAYLSGNILFNGQTEIQDSFDVANANQNLERVFNQDTVTFLNDLDNDTKGWDDSNDVINGQRE